MPPENGMPVAEYNDLDTPAIEESIPEPAPVEDTPSAPVMSKHETTARESGWVGVDEWKEMGRDPEDHVSPKEFNRAGEMISRIKSQNDQIKQMRASQQSTQDKQNALEDTMRQLLEHNQSITQSQIETTRKDLYNQRAQAMQEGDVTSIASLDEAIDQVRDVARSVSQPRPEEPGDPEPQMVVDKGQAEVQEWMDRPENSWFHSDTSMKGAFLSHGDAVADELGPQASMPEILNEAKKRLVKEFPSRFGGAKPPPQSGDSQQGSNATGTKSASGYSVNDLTDEQRRVGNAFVDADSSGKFTMQTYVDQLAAIGGIGE